MCTGVEETDPSRFADLAQRIASEHHKPATNKETHNASHIHIIMTNNVTSNKDPSGGENSSETNSAGKKSDGVNLVLEELILLPKGLVLVLKKPVLILKKLIQVREELVLVLLEVLILVKLKLTLS